MAMNARRESYAQLSLGAYETPFTTNKKSQRPTAMKFLEESKEDEDGFGYNEDSDQGNHLEEEQNNNCDAYMSDKRSMTLRANSPSPIRKLGSLLDLFNTTNNDSSIALTQF